MAKYRLLNDSRYDLRYVKQGAEYPDHRIVGMGILVQDAARKHPEDWELVEEFIDKEDVVNHPKHYKKYPVETIDMMEAIWGKEKVAIYCLLNAFKYRMRMGMKDDIKQDLSKEEWYLDKYNKLQSYLK